MHTKFWEIIRDDTKRTFEVCGHTSNTNSFTNKVHGMQKAGLNVSYMTPPVTNKASNRDALKISGYTYEEGLYERISQQYREITLRDAGEW